MSRSVRVCGKLCYGSKRAAREAHAAVSWRVRCYWCGECRSWHVTNTEKSRRFA